MLISPTQCAEFRRLRTALMEFAIMQGLKEDAWLSPQTVERFVAANPAGLSVDSLGRIELWGHAAGGPFFVMRHTDTCSIFMNALGTFAVRGTERELKAIVPKTPTLVDATLLPFDGHIVCATDPTFEPEALGEASRADIDATYKALADKGVVYSAAAMVRALSQPTSPRRYRTTPPKPEADMAPAEPGPVAAMTANPTPAIAPTGARPVAPAEARPAAAMAPLIELGPATRHDSRSSATLVATMPRGLAQIIAFKPARHASPTLS